MKPSLTLADASALRWMQQSLMDRQPDAVYQLPPHVNPAPYKMVVVDAGIADYQVLATGVTADAAILILDVNRDGVEQITEALNTYSTVTSLHLVSHGVPGCLYLGNTTLSLESIDRYASALQYWLPHQGSQLLLYGCHVAAGDAGAELIDRLQQLTGAAIAASTTPTGSAALGGDWHLDVTTNDLEVALCFHDGVLHTYPAVLAAGDLDNGFGNGGKVVTAFGDRASSYGLTLQPDGKILSTGYVKFGSNSYFALSRYNSDGTLDTGFGNGGKVSTDFYSTTPDIYGNTNDRDAGINVLVQADGKIIVAGETVSSSLDGFGLVRYNSDGSLDTSFGSGGKVSTRALGYTGTLGKAILQSDGKILLVEDTRDSRSGNFALVRYNSDGSFDNNFGPPPNPFYPSAPSAISTDVNYRDIVSDAAQQSDGKIVVLGTSRPDKIFGNNDLTLLRYNPNGSLDPSFGTGGIVKSNFSATDRFGFDDAPVSSLAVTPDGKIVVVANTSAAYGNSQIALFRYSSTGSLDPTFGNGGRLITTIGGVNGGVKIDADGRIVIAAQNNGDFVLARYSSDGVLDSSFGSGGKVTTDFGTSSDSPSDLVIQPDGRIVATGTANGSFALARYESGGSPAPTNQAPTDITIGGRGFLLENFPVTPIGNAYYNSVPLVTIDPDVTDLHTYTLVAGAGDTSNALFTIDGSLLIPTQSLDFEANPAYTIRVRTDDRKGGIFEKAIAVPIINFNDAPVVVAPIPNQVAPAGSSFSYTVPDTTFFDQDAGDVLTLSATLSNGNPLPTWLSFNPTTRTFSGTPGGSSVGTLNLSVIARDKGFGGLSYATSTDFTLTIAASNAPTDLSLSNATVAENLIATTIVGSLTTTDPDVGDIHTYTLVSGTGSTDNAVFSIVGDTLRTAQSFNFESKSTYSVRVRTDDGKGGTFEKPLTINILDINEVPTVTTSIANQTTATGTPFTFVVPASTFTDPDAGDGLTLIATLSDGSALPTWLSFDPIANQFSGTPGIGNAGTLSLLLKASDRAGLSTTTGFNLTVTNPATNRAPTNLTLSNARIAENLASGAIVGTLTTTDPDVGDTPTYSLVSGTGSTDNAAFTVVGNTLRTTRSFNFESKTSYTVRVRTDDGKGGIFEKPLTINILNVNDAPVVKVPITNKTATVGKAFRFVVPATTFFDEDAAANDDLDGLTLRATLANGNALPSWLKFNSTTGTFSGTPTSGNVGTLNLLVKATDWSGASISTGFALTIQ